jgi:hypothetical protein
MLAEAVQSAASTVVAALQRASAATGTDFRYLLGTAMRESGLKPQAQSSTSSAAGLFQFVEQTWLGLVKEFGAKHGLGSYANAISRGADGHFRAGDAGDRRAILALRNDPQVSALMAGEYARQTQAEMQSSLGREVCGGELYAAHFLGPDAACRLIRLNDAAPDASAAAQFPQAAGANRNVFYHADGTPKTVREVYAWATSQPAANMPATNLASAAVGPVVTGVDNYAELLAAMWGPSHHGFFSTGTGSASPFRLSADMLSVLSSVAKDRGAS